VLLPLRSSTALSVELLFPVVSALSVEPNPRLSLLEVGCCQVFV
jgi:hypothetical protein